MNEYECFDLMLTGLNMILTLILTIYLATISNRLSKKQIEIEERSNKTALYEKRIEIIQAYENIQKLTFQILFLNRYERFVDKPTKNGIELIEEVWRSYINDENRVQQAVKSVELLFPKEIYEESIPVDFKFRKLKSYISVLFASKNISEEQFAKTGAEIFKGILENSNAIDDSISNLLEKLNRETNILN